MRTLTHVLKHPHTPWAARIVASLSVGYIFSPIQLIPTFIPVIGQLDDIAVLLLGMKLVRRLTPGAVLAECEERTGPRTPKSSLAASTSDNSPGLSHRAAAS
jgi:uncharacterized membrane protein YkvA (DUF1232 family)